jgi:ABC-type glycerol-3-phosphate transport system substrate-binding protein
MKIKFLAAFAGVIVLVLAGCSGGSSSSTPAQSNTTANNSSPIVQPEIYAQQKVDVASLNQAIQQYNASEGHNPQTLQDLVPNYLAKIPQAPSGYKINYDAASGSASVVKQ